MLQRVRKEIPKNLLKTSTSSLHVIQCAVVYRTLVAKVGEVSNVAQVAQICKGEMAERRSEETILAESLSYIDKNYSLLIIQVIKHT